MKTVTLQIRLQAKEKEAFEKASEIAGIALSAWVRERLRRSARQELVSVGAQVPFLQEE